MGFKQELEWFLPGEMMPEQNFNLLLVLKGTLDPVCGIYCEDNEWGVDGTHNQRTSNILCWAYLPPNKFVEEVKEQQQIAKRQKELAAMEAEYQRLGKLLGKPGH